MPRFVALRDQRLNGTVQVTPQLLTITVDEATSLFQAFHAIGTAAGPTRVKAMFVLCHGFAGQNKQRGLCMDAGGMGLLLGRENLRHSNVSFWRFMRERIENIVIYACAAADTQPGNEGSTSDGRYLMSALALHTNADVYAADRIQYYVPGIGSSYNFGAWEGTLFHFTPSGAVNSVRRAPYEFADVLNGSV